MQVMYVSGQFGITWAREGSVTQPLKQMEHNGQDSAIDSPFSSFGFYNIS